MYLRQANKTARQSQELIAEGLFRLMDRKPFSQIRITELCQEAGVGRKTFYRNFQTKEDVVEFRLDQMQQEYLAEMTPCPWEGRLRQHFTYVQQRMKVFLTLYDQGFYGRIHRKFGEVAPAFLPVGRKDQVEWEYRSQFLIEGLEALERVWVERDLEESREKVVEMARKLTETLV